MADVDDLKLYVTNYISGCLDLGVVACRHERFPITSIKQAQFVVGRLQIKIIETTHINNKVFRRGTRMTKGVDTTMLTEKMLRYFRVELVSRQRLFTTHQAESFG